MTKRVTWRPAALLSALLLTAGASRAGYQEVNGVGWLGTGSWELREAKGQAYLVKAPHSTPRASWDLHTDWTVSAPAIKTMKAGRDLRLGYDAKGRDPKARVVAANSDDKTEGKGAEGASTRWAFEVVERIKPWEGHVKQTQHLVKKGSEGITFRAMATEGPYKGWYLAAKEDGKGKRSLVLVREKKKATVFKYIHVYYDVR
jgi:hypothetical protein